MRALRSSAFAAAALFVAQAAFAQAFVPAKGEATLSIYVQSAEVKQHMFAEFWADVGHVTLQTLAADFSVGLGRGFAASVSLPYAAAKYSGKFPHDLDPSEQSLRPTFSFSDDGKYHGTAQDFHFVVRRQLLSRGAVVTPFVSYILPSHDYEFLAHAAVGWHTRELQVGAFVARVMQPWWKLPTGFVQGRYSLGFEQTFADVARRRSNMAIEGGYFVTTKLRAFGTLTGQITHGGIDVKFSPRLEHPAPSPVYVHHDQIVRENKINVGAGAAYTVTDKIDVFGSWTRTVKGINGHAFAHIYTIGLSYSFQIGTPKTDMSMHGESCQKEENTLAKCLCLKK